MRKLTLTHRDKSRVYNDARIAQALLFLDRSDMSLNHAAKELGIPRSTITKWKHRYLDEDEFAERIDKFIDIEEEGGGN